MKIIYCENKNETKVVGVAGRMCTPRALEKKNNNNHEIKSIILTELMRINNYNRTYERERER